jgi:hypothetical protein
LLAVGAIDEGIDDEGELVIKAGAVVLAFGSGQRISSKQDVPAPHMESSSLQVCKAYEQDDKTSDKLEAQ